MPHPNLSFEDTVMEPVEPQFWHKPIFEINGWKIQHWMEWIRSGKEVPPIYVAYHEARPTWWRKGGLDWYVHDGTHRLSAMRFMAGKKECWAEVLSERPPWTDMGEWKFAAKKIRVR